MHTIQNRKLLMLRPKDITLPLLRYRKEVNGYALYSLAESIKQTGIITPLSVRKTENGKYELISGERRLKAAILVGLRRVPCVLHEVDAATAAVYSVVENLSRKNLTFFEEAQSIKSIIVKYRITHIEMALKLGISQNSLLEKLRLLRLDENLRRRIEDALLSESHARSLLSLPPEKREKALEVIINENLTALQTEVFINELLNPKPVAKKASAENTSKSDKAPCRKSAIGDIRLFSNSLQKLTDTLKNSGIDAFIRRTENERYIEYKVRIPKEEPQREIAEQLKIC